MVKEKWVLTRTLHMGFCRETFEKGAILELHESESGSEFLQVGGRRFDKVQDLEILKRQLEKYPQDPWIIAFDENSVELIEKPKVISITNKPNVIKAQHKKDKIEVMKIVQSDMDLMETDIDISHTKNTRIQAEKKAKEDAGKVKKMTIVKGQDNVSDEIPIEPRKEMSIVNGDEEYGVKGNGYASLNSGTVKAKTASEVAQMREEALDGSGGSPSVTQSVSEPIEGLENTDISEAKAPEIKKAKKVVKKTKKAKKVETPTDDSKSKRGRPKKEKTPEAIAEEKAKKAAYQREYRAKQKAKKEGK